MASSMPELDDIVCALTPVACKYFELGTHLKIKRHQLTSIESKHYDDSRSLIEVIGLWQDNSETGECTWSALAKAVERIEGHGKLAKELWARDVTKSVTSMEDSKAGFLRSQQHDSSSQTVSTDDTGYSSKSTSDSQMSGDSSGSEPECFEFVPGCGCSGDKPCSSVYKFCAEGCPNVHHNRSRKMPVVTQRKLQATTRNCNEIPSDLEGDTEKYEEKTKQIQKHFGRFVTDTCRSFKEKKVDPQELILKIRLSFPMINARINELNKNPCLGQVFNIVADHACSWFDYEVIKEIINYFGDTSDKIRLQQYEDHFREYAHERLPNGKKHIKIGDGGKQGCKQLVIKIDKEWEEVTFNDIDKVRGTFASVFGIRRRDLYLADIREGCIMMTFMITEELAGRLFPSKSCLTSSQVKFLRDEGVISLRCGKFIWRMMPRAPARQHRRSNASLIFNNSIVKNFLFFLTLGFLLIFYGYLGVSLTQVHLENGGCNGTRELDIVLMEQQWQNRCPFVTWRWRSHSRFILHPFPLKACRADHGPSHTHWRQLNGVEIKASDQYFVMDGLFISSKFSLITRNRNSGILQFTARLGNSTNSIQTLKLHLSEQCNGILQFTARLGNSTNSTQTLVIIPPQMEKVQLLNSCGDITHGDGRLCLNLTLSSDFPALSRQFSDQLLVQLQLNFSLIPKLPNQGTNSMTHIVNISDTFYNQWTGGGSVQLDVSRVVVLGQLMERIMSSGERFRAQVKLIFNRVTAAERSPVCESPIFQSCLDTTTVEIKLKLKFSSEDQCSRYPALKIKRAIESLLREEISCDNITVQSAEEYCCNQREKMSFLRANLYAKDRLKHFSYLRTGQLSLFDSAINISEGEDLSIPAPYLGSNMAYVYVCIVVTILLCLLVTAIMIITITTAVKKFRKKFKPKDKDPESKEGDNRPCSSASSSRSQNFYVEDRSLSRSPMSPVSQSSSVLARTPNDSHSHTPNHSSHDIHTPHSTHTPHDHSSHYPKEPVPQAHLYHQVINLEGGNSAGIPLHCVQTYLSNQDSNSASTGACEMTTLMSEQEVRGNQQSRAESSIFGDDILLTEFEPRIQCMELLAMRSTPSSGYQSRQGSSLSRHYQKAPRQRHNTEGHPVTAPVQLSTTAGGGYLVLHGLDLTDRQRTSSMSQLRPATLLQTNLMHVQPASSADMQNRTCEMTPPSIRSRDHFRLHLPGAMQLHHPSKELRTVIPGEVMSPHHRLSDPNPPPQGKFAVWEEQKKSLPGKIHMTAQVASYKLV